MHELGGGGISAASMKYPSKTSALAGVSKIALEVESKDFSLTAYRSEIPEEPTYNNLKNRSTVPMIP